MSSRVVIYLALISALFFSGEYYFLSLSYSLESSCEDVMAPAESATWGEIKNIYKDDGDIDDNEDDGKRSKD